MKTIRTQLFHILLPIILLLSIQSAPAQLNPLSTQYYSNQYLGNSAIAGIDSGIKVGVAHRKQWSGIPGSPSTQAITAEYGGKRVGIGLNMNNDAAGLLKRTRVVATYAYHLPLNNKDEKLHFGLSIGMMYERVMNEQIDGDITDLSIDKVNRRESYVDGDFGAAYTTGKFTLQAAIPNLHKFVKKNKDFRPVDYSQYLAAFSYRWNFGAGNATSLEPKITYRGIRGHHDIVDIGLNLGVLEDRMNLLGIYHTTESATFGLGAAFKSFFITGMYTTETAALRSYIDGHFELGLSYRFSNNQKK